MPPYVRHMMAVMVSGAMALMSAPSVAQAPAPPAGATAQAGQPVSQEQLEQLVAPIALYTDALVAQILMASTYPLEVVEAARWRKSNASLKDKALEDALQNQPWDPSVKSLAVFPQVLDMMNEKLSWTQQLGDVFLSDQARVLAAVQALRKRAHEQGNLKSSKEQNVVVEQENAQTIIRIEQANPQVVYVPVYNPTVVYGPWPYPAYPPYYYYPPGYVPGAAFWTFTAGVIVGSALWGNCNWGRGDVYINHNNYNNFNRTNISGNNKWNHNVDHRRGVSYKDPKVAQQFNRGGASTRDVQNREQFRGRAEQGRADMGQRFDGTGAADRGGGRGGAQAGTRDVSRGGFDGGRQGAFGGADSGRQAGNFSSRGQSSRQSAGSFGGGGGARASGGGGGARAGGGGGRGGGGRR